MIQTDRAPDDAEASPDKTDGTNAFLRSVVKRFARVEASEAQNRVEAIDDIKFRAGDQWPEDIKAARNVDKRPCLTINKVNTFVHQITNEQRQNRPSIKISPVGDRSDKQTAEMLQGLIRQIERQSRADLAYDRGFDSAVTIGWGFWRVITDYEYDDSFDQCIKIEAIRNPFRVYLDPDRQSPTGEDAQWAFITDLITREEFKEQWPDVDPMDWQEAAMGDESLWSTSTHIRIAEYFQFETRDRRLLALENGHIGFYDELAPSLKAQVDAKTLRIIKERAVSAKHVVWYKLTAHEVLEEQAWPGKWIPIIEVVGNEYDVEGEVSRQGLVRAMKDPQRMYNFWSTAETEEVALRPKAPWLIEEGQIEGHEKEWRQANNKNMSYLVYRNTNVGGKPTPMPQRQQFQGVPAAVVQAKQGAAQDMQAVTGVRWDATLQERMHDESGKALRELKRVGDLGNFHYTDNLARSLCFTGWVLIDLIIKVMDTPRILTILREDGSEENVKIDPQAPQAYQKTQEGDQTQRIFNPRVGEYAVAVNIGPNYQTKRQEAAESMLSFMQAVPNAAPMIADLIAQNMDWPGSEEIASRLQSMLPPHMLDKKLENLPPEAKGIIGSLTQQLQKMKEEHDKAVAMLGDADKDRAVDVEKISKDFQAKQDATLAKFITDMEKLKQATDSNNPDSEFAKIQADLMAKLAAVEADSQAKYAQMIADQSMAMDQMQLEHHARTKELEHKQRETDGKLENDRKANEAKAELGKQQTDKNSEMKSIKAAVEKLMKTVESQADFEVEIVRDPKSNQIRGARRKYH